MCAGNGMPRLAVCTGGIAPATAQAMHDWRDVFAPKTLNSSSKVVACRTEATAQLSTTYELTNLKQGASLSSSLVAVVGQQI